MLRTRPSSHVVLRVLGRLAFVSLFLVKAHAAPLAYWANSASSQTAGQQIQAAARFYGLDLQTQTLNNPQDAALALKSLSSASPLGLVLDASILPWVSRPALLASLASLPQPVPILITGINAQSDANSLTAWSGGAITGARSLSSGRDVSEQIGPADAVTRQLAGIRLPLANASLSALTLSTSHPLTPVVQALVAGQPFATFVRQDLGSQPVFFAADLRPGPIEVSADPFRQQAIFGSLAAPMMFVRLAAGDRGWHSPGAYANFTIDDLWLREPYGHVNYGELLAHSQEHNFHSTIAFIPWNYDRNHADVAALFRAHPDRLSICVHGNDHIHQEFGPLSSHPLATQVRNINQSLARMKRFSELTGIPFDRVMVFPHSVSPEKTFAELKRANYLGTANSLNTPSDVAAPAGEEFALRTATLDFANFPSLRRYSAETDIPKAQLAIDAFLGNPILFYAHESFFATGSDAFDHVADTVNQLQPDLHWVGLAAVMQHLYLEKEESDGTISVRAYSPQLLLHNDSGKATTYHIQKEENFQFPVALLVDGHPASYQRMGTTLTTDLLLPPGSTRLVELHYGTPGPQPAEQLRSYSITAAPIRYLSDFRDNFVSDTALGRWFIRSYVDFGTRWRVGALCIAVFLGLVALSTKRRRHAQRGPQPFSGILPS